MLESFLLLRPLLLACRFLGELCNVKPSEQDFRFSVGSLSAGTLNNGVLVCGLNFGELGGEMAANDALFGCEKRLGLKSVEVQSGSLAAACEANNFSYCDVLTDLGRAGESIETVLALAELTFRLTRSALFL